MPDTDLSVPPGTVLVDWDNTLHDAAGTFFRALRVVMRDRGVEVDRAAYRDAYDPDYRVLYRRLGLDARDVEAASGAWRALVRASRPRLLAGAREALERIRGAGVPLAVVTGAPRAQVERQLATLGLAWLTAVVSGGEAAAARPDPAPLYLARERLAATPPPFVYVGDTTPDMAMAAAAGMRGVGIAGFAADEMQLRAAGADETAPSFAAWTARWLPA